MGLLQFARDLHATVREHARFVGSVVHIHEQSASSRLDDTKDWPWAISSDSDRRSVPGCTVGLVSKNGEPMGKSWTCEVEGCSHLLNTFDRLVCTHSENHAPAVGSNTKVTECYPVKLAWIIVLAALR